MSDFFTSDAHFFHCNILKFELEARPFSSLDEMNQVIIERWNSKVTPFDTVYIAGDVTFEKNKSFTGTIDILNQLNGKKILIKGNHDSVAVRCEAFRNCFESIHDMVHYYNNKNLYVICHYPMLSWKNSHRGSFQLFGHLHSKWKGNKKQLNVGMDCHNLTPISIEEVHEKLESIIPTPFPEY